MYMSHISIFFNISVWLLTRVQCRVLYKLRWFGLCVTQIVFLAEATKQPHDTPVVQHLPGALVKVHSIVMLWLASRAGQTADISCLHCFQRPYSLVIQEEF